MLRPLFVQPIFVLFVLWVQSVLQAETSSDWLRGVGDQMEVRLRGEVFDVAGLPASGAVVVGNIFSKAGSNPIAIKVEGNRFEAWVPVNRQSLYSISLKASLNGDEQLAYKSLNAFELRQAAIDGLKFSLLTPSRQVIVKVIDSGRPVSGANLIAGLGRGPEIHSVTDDSGIVELKLLPDQRLFQLTAWTDDYRIGGYGFDRTPARDPAEDLHVVELSPCRNLKMRFVDQSGVAVPGVEFALHVATPEPNFNYLGQTENTRMQTDPNGEAVYRWFPNWKEHFFYAESKSDQWYVDQEKEVIDDVVVFKLTRTKIEERKRITGNLISSVSDVGGFYVLCQSFQADRKGYSDHLSTFTGSDGTFSVDVLPDSTYCVFGIDSKWVTDIIDLIPYQSTSGKITAPVLTLSQGQQVDVLVTTGPDHKPYPNLPVSFQSEYNYSWLEEGNKQTGLGGPRWFATTDPNGRIQTPANAGKLNVSIYTPLWQTKETHDVSMGQPTKITLHREMDAKRKFKMQLTPPPGLDAKLDNASIRIGALGGVSRDNQSLNADSTGAFAFETSASPFGVFARTQDGRAAGLLVFTGQEVGGKLTLRPTLAFVGQLIDEEGKPVAGVSVTAKVIVEGKKVNIENNFVGSSFDAIDLVATTDHQGKYKIEGIPCEMKVRLTVAMSPTSENKKHLGNVWLEEKESRPALISRIGEAKSVAKTLANRLDTELRDSRLLGFPVMVILSDKSKVVADFVTQNFVNYELNAEVASFLQFVVPREKASLKESDESFFKQHGWRVPSEGRVVAYVLDAQGREQGSLEVNVNEADADKKVADFVSKHQRAKLDAEKKWNEAFAEAKRTNRKVWARVSQRYCGPCFLLARWMDDHRELLERDYVMLKIDDVADENGEAIARRITRDGRFGIPFYAIFDTDEVMVVDSNSPLGNIGYPGGYEGIKFLRKMLLATRNSLTDAEVEQLVTSLENE